MKLHTKQAASLVTAVAFLAFALGFAIGWWIGGTP